MVEFREHGPRLHAAEVRALELTLGVDLPASYRAFLLKWNGGSPEPDVVDVPGLPGSEADVQVFFGLRRVHPCECIEWNAETLIERLRYGDVPIACDSGGSVFCISVRAKDFGSVSYCDLKSVFADYESPPPFYPVASDFDSFVAQLREWRG